ncbi:MAG: serine hydrolase [Rubrivivax sp.]
MAPALRRRRLLAWLATPALLPAPAARAEALWPGADWPRREAAASGWQVEALRRADDQARELGTEAALVVHRGAVVHAFGDIERPLAAYSVRKSVLGALLGMAHARGQLDLQATLAQLDIDDVQGLIDAERQATVQQLLQSRSGVYHGAAYETAEAAATRPLRGSHVPGSFWYYNNWDFNALGTIHRRVTGIDVFEALERELARPLQWQDFRREAHTRWVFERVSRHGAYTMELSTRDLARLGLLMARGGRWRDQVLVPEAWIDESARPWSVLGAGWQAYGYLWWVPQRAWPFWTRREGELFFASGNYGQYLWVDRARDLVVVHRTSGFSLLRRSVDLVRVTPWLSAVIAAAPTF